MLNQLGLILDATGAFLVLVPDIPRLRQGFENIPPLKSVEKAKRKLYLESEELLPEDPGFSRLQEAIISGTQPFADVPRWDEIEESEVTIEVAGETLQFDEPGFRAVKITKEDDKPLSQSTFAVEYKPNAVVNMEEYFKERDVPSPGSPKIKAELPPGRLPQLVEEYKRRLVSRTGAGLLVIGFLLQIFATQTSGF